MKWLLACLLLTSCTPAPTPHNSEEILEAWREALLLDLPGELLKSEQATLLQHPGLLTTGEALDLRVRARLSNSDLPSAKELIATTSLNSDEARYGSLTRARIALSTDQLDEVSRLLMSKERLEVITECIDMPDAWLLLARAHARAGKHADAAHLMHEFARRAPLHREASSAWHFLADHANRRQQSALSRRYATAAVQAAQWQGYYQARLLQVRENPSATLPRIGLVILWMQAGKPQAAKDELDRIFALEPNHCEALGHLAEAERKLENFDAAKLAYDRALKCAPQKVGLRFNRAYLADLQGRTADARNDYEWIVSSEHETDPRFLDAHLELARILLGENDAAGSAEHFERYVELGGKEPLAK